MSTEQLLTSEQFAALYEHLTGEIASVKTCGNKLTHTLAWLRAHNLYTRTNIEKIIDMGGHCDCEVLMNVTVRKWRKGLKTAELHALDVMSEHEWCETVDRFIARS